MTDTECKLLALIIKLAEAVDAIHVHVSDDDGYPAAEEMRVVNQRIAALRKAADA